VNHLETDLKTVKINNLDTYSDTNILTTSTTSLYLGFMLYTFASHQNEVINVSEYYFLHQFYDPLSHQTSRT